MNKKLAFVFSLIIVLTIIFIGCTPAENDGPIRIATLSGPSGMGIVNLFDDTDNYDVSVFTAPDQISAKVINGEIDIATIPSNLAAILYDRTNKGIEILSVNTLGVLYIIGAKTSEITSITDIDGMTLNASGQGATPDFVLAHIIDYNEVDVNVVYSAEHSALAAEMIAGTKTLAILPEPFVSLVLAGNSNLEIKIAIDDEWKNIYGDEASLPMTTTIARKSYLQANPERVAKFITDYKASVTFVNAEPASAAVKIAENGIFANQAVTIQAIPRCKISFIEGENMKSILQDYYQVLFAANPNSVGGSIPDDGIY